MRVVRWLIAIAIIAFVCWLFPLFHVVPLKTATAEKAAEKFDPDEFRGEISGRKNYCLQRTKP